MDYSKIAKAEKLAPLEVELRKLEKVVQEIWDEMEYLKTREAKMRDTNGNFIIFHERLVTILNFTN
jgi:hypothetical protein